MKYLLILASFLVAQLSLADECADTKRQLSKSYEQMIDNGNYSGSDIPYETREKLLVSATKRFTQTLISYLQKSQSWQCDFSKLGLYSATSLDKRIRLFSWDLQTGGTGHDYDGVIQFYTQLGKTKVLTWGSNNEMPDLLDGFVFEADFSRQGRVYGIRSITQGSSRDFAQTLSLYRIESEQLIPAKIIQTSEKTHKLSYSYDMFSFENLPVNQSACDNGFVYREKNQTLLLPVVLASNNYSSGKMTNHCIHYQFDGRQFIRTRN